MHVHSVTSYLDTQDAHPLSTLLPRHAYPLSTLLPTHAGCKSNQYTPTKTPRMHVNSVHSFLDMQDAHPLSTLDSYLCTCDTHLLYTLALQTRHIHSVHPCYLDLDTQDTCPLISWTQFTVCPSETWILPTRATLPLPPPRSCIRLSSMTPVV